MAKNPLFTGLVYDDNDQFVETTLVGEEPCYVVDDDGFKRHIPSEQVDRQVLNRFRELIEGNEEILSEQALKMIGQDDLFSRAIYIEQLKNIDKQFNQLLEAGYPEEVRAYMGMTGFKVIINHHGDVLEVEQPGMIEEDE
ncbi:MAG: hypothetical protein MUO54_12500 [Anaerolineales bacterium]|nr:hypothetical protein [Anaerolineales bacterium]